MENSPYSPPTAIERHAQSESRSLADNVFFIINFVTATLFFMACVISIGTADNPFAFLGGVLAVIPVVSYAIAEWTCWYRRYDWLYRPLGILNLLLSAFFVFALVTNIGEVLMSDEAVDPLFILLFGLGFAIVAVYLGWCGWRRIRKMPSEPICE